MRTFTDEERKLSQFSIIVGGEFTCDDERDSVTCTIIAVSGTSIERVVARKFAADTGANLSLHDLSVKTLSADYDHFLDSELIEGLNLYLVLPVYVVVATSLHFILMHCTCLLYTSPSPRDATLSRMPSSA